LAPAEEVAVEEVAAVVVVVVVAVVVVVVVAVVEASAWALPLRHTQACHKSMPP
jgi:hypothetical protein